MRARALWRFDESAQAAAPMDALRTVADLQLAPPVFSSPERARATLGYGRWGHCWDMQAASSVLAPTWGGVPFTPSGSPLYRQLGMRAGDYSIGLGHGAYANHLTTISMGSTLAMGAADDGAILLAFPRALSNGGEFYAFFIGNFATHEYKIRFLPSGAGTGLVEFVVDDGDPGSVGVQVAYPNSAFVLGAALVRGTSRTRIGVCAIGGTATLSGEADCSTIGSLDAGAGMSTVVGLGAMDSPTLISHMMLARGPQAAAGVSANLGTVLERYASAVSAVPPVVTASAARGRSFVAVPGHTYEAVDVVAGDTLLTGDCSVMALVRWDEQEQAAPTRWRLVGNGSGGGVWDSGMHSFASLTGDFMLEATSGPTSGIWRTFAVGANGGVSYDHGTPVYFWYLQGDGTAKVRCPSAGPYVDAFNAGAFVATDVFGIRRVGSTIAFLKNGVVVYTSPTTTSAALRVRAHFFNVGANFDALYLASGGPFTWESITNVPVVTPSGNVGTLYARGRGADATDLISAAVEVRVANASLRIGELRWLWQDTSGAIKRQLGGYFQAPSDGGEMLLTATRRWVSASKVVLRYYIGDQMLAEVESSDGSIGGSAAGSTMIGGRFLGRYPRTAAQMAAATRPGTVWVAGYLADELATPLVPVFGSGLTAPNLVAQNNPTYQHVGPRFAHDGSDRAVGVRTSNRFNAGDSWNLSATDVDLGIAAVLRVPPDLTGGARFWGRNGGGKYVVIDVNGDATDNVQITIFDGVTTVAASTTVGSAVADSWLAVMTAIDRTTGKMSIAVAPSSAPTAPAWSGESSIAAVGSLSNVGTDCIIGDPGAQEFYISALYVAYGLGACTGLSANLPDAVRNFATTVFGGYGDFFDGVIDELEVVDGELSPDDVARVWSRLSKGSKYTRMLKALLPPGKVWR